MCPTASSPAAVSTLDVEAYEGAGPVGEGRVVLGHGLHLQRVLAGSDVVEVLLLTEGHHVGLVVRSPRLERVTELLDEYARRFVEEFSAVMPPPERVE